ncbi:hypothetical protein [Rheinheimera texasensis]|uniref:hypothetical protein n=1 Tax=Rheinheimera texasensis TaxID=306205 RepID=UPI0032B1382C
MSDSPLTPTKTSSLETQRQLDVNATFLCCQSGIAKYLGVVVGFLCADTAQYVTGQVIAVDGGLVL